jgi:shikimate kinase
MSTLKKNRSKKGSKIFLIGFMGSGKTFWGRVWAQKCNLDFFDLDEVIELEQKKSIASIFKEKGEVFFRDIETAALKTFSVKDNCIIACGGGTACFNDNIQWMNEQGKTVYLSASPQYIFDRVMDEQKKRPLLNKLNKAELLFFIEQKLKERESFYQQAKFILPVDELTDDFIPEFLNS